MDESPRLWRLSPHSSLQSWHGNTIRSSRDRDGVVFRGTEESCRVGVGEGTALPSASLTTVKVGAEMVI